MESVSLEDLRTYNGQKVTQLKVGEVVKFKDTYYVVESVGLAVPFELTPIIKDPSRECLTLEN